MRRLLCIWFPNWPIQRVQSIRRASGETFPDHHPVVLWHQHPRRGRLVIARCQHAESLGVRIGMPVAQAGEMIQGIGERSNDSSSAQRIVLGRSILQQHDPGLDQEALQKVTHELQRQITPVVAMETLDKTPWAGHPRHQVESLLCDITGVAHLFGGESGLLDAVRSILASKGFQARLALAPSVGSAWAMAHYGRQGIYYLDTLRDRLSQLPIEALRISDSIAQTLSRLGIQRIGELLQLPRDGLASRLGPILLQRIDQGLATIEEPLQVCQRPPDDSATMVLEYPTTDAEILADRIGRLAGQVRAGLVTRQRGALRVTCRLDLTTHQSQTLEIGLFAPSIDDDHWTGLLLHQLDSHPLAACVERLTLQVTLSEPLRTKQTTLFDHAHQCSADGPWHDSRLNEAVPSGSVHEGPALGRLIDSLSSRLGRDAVVRVKLTHAPLPEHAFESTPLTGQLVSKKSQFGKLHTTSKSRAASKPRAGTGSGSNPNARSNPFPHHTPSDQSSRLTDKSTLPAPSLPAPTDAMRRPLCLLADPIPLVTADATGTWVRFTASPSLPSRFRFRGTTYRIACAWGPERIETGWWKGPTIGRDYFRIETDQGCWWWIFRNLISRSKAGPNGPRYRWMLHGWFQ